MEDPFLDKQTCINRLYQDYQRHNSLVVAFDFDNTVYDFHNKQYTFPKVISLLKECQTNNLELFCFTANKNYQLVTEHLECIGLYNIPINESSVDVGSLSKPYFNVLLDDRAGLHDAYVQLSEVLILIKEQQ